MNSHVFYILEVKEHPEGFDVICNLGAGRAYASSTSFDTAVLEAVHSALKLHKEPDPPVPECA